MKKLAIAFAVISAMFVSAKAEMLMWQVDSSNYGQWSLTGTEANAYTSLYYYDGSMHRVAQASGLTQGYYDTSWSSTPVLNDSYSYWIEVGTYDASGELTKGGYYGEFSYSQLALSATGLSASAMRALVNTSMSHKGPVPEPTSGLMMLVGMALLGLKRRRV